MPIYLLTDKIEFPPVDGAEDGIVAIGGDLSVQRLIKAYQSGIFPWYSIGEPIIWHAPDPRFILHLQDLHISNSMRRVLNSNRLVVTIDTDFSKVIHQCATIERKEQDGTWITDEMITAYEALHLLGYAHSVEVWQDEQLVGGLYGVSLGKVFFAESMFHLENNASKFALIKLVEYLKKNDFHFIDAQVHTKHMETMGAKNISRTTFMHLLKTGLQFETSIGKWSFA